MSRVRKYVHQVLEVAEEKSGASWYFDITLTILILLNAIAIVLESVQSIHEPFKEWFHLFELVSIIFFSIEYVLRIWSCVEFEKFKNPVSGRIKFIFTPLAIIDILAIIPFYLVMFTIDLRYIRILRVFRLFRLFKLTRYVKALNAIGKVFQEKKEQLVISMVMILFLLLIASCVMYYVENEAQPEVFTSIPETMWWGIATLTTVGYGDMYPVTGLGQLLGGIIAILGIGLFALPTGILAAGFSKVIGADEEEQNKCTCPNCGHEIIKQ